MVPGALTRLRPEPVGQPRARVHEPGVPLRDRDGDAGADEGPLERGELDVLGERRGRRRRRRAARSGARASSAEVSRTGTSSSGGGLGHVGDPSRAPAARARDRPAVRSGAGVGRPGGTQIRPDPLGQGLGRPAVAASGEGRTDQERRAGRDRAGQLPRASGGAAPASRRAEQRSRAPPSPAPSTARCSDQLARYAAARARASPVGRPAVQLVQLADQHDLDAGDEHGLGAQLAAAASAGTAGANQCAADSPPVAAPMPEVSRAARATRASAISSSEAPG